MTALCGGGASSAKPGQEAALIYSSGLLVQVLEELSVGWLAPLIPLVPLAPFVLSTFCATDPPAFSNLTMAEANALLQLEITSPDYGTGLAKLPNIFANAIWNYSCQCTSGTYTPPAPTQPIGTTVVVQPQAPQNGPCQTTCVVNNGVGQQPCQDQIAGGTTIIGGATLLPGANVTAMQTVWTYDGGGTQPTTEVFQNKYFNSSSAQIAQFNHTINAGTLTDSWYDAIPAGAVNFTVTTVVTGGGGASLQHITWNQFCNGQVPGGTQQPCCPPDSATQGYLDNILKMVTLIQRQQVPFAYVLGTVHSSLTGSGELSVQGLLGAKVMPASTPSWAGVDVGDPDTLWLDSWINWGNADGWTAREFLRSAPFVSMPAYAGQFTKIGYTLAPGLTVDLTELVREA